jgi:DNA-binding MarR family transcriptional regulator
VAQARSRVAPVDFHEGLGYQLRLTHRLIQRLLALKFEEGDVTVPMWYFLRTLWEEDGLTQRELANRTGIQEPSTLAAILQLEKRGLVNRVRNTEDKRKINVFLTDQGLELLKGLLPIALEVLQIAKGDISKPEIDGLFALLHRIQQNTESEIKEIVKSRLQGRRKASSRWSDEADVVGDIP